MSKGMIMLSAGAIGLILTVFWILIDLVNRKKHEEKVVEKAILNLKSSELRTGSTNNNSSNISNKIESNKEIINDINSDDKTEIIYNDKEEKTEIITEEVFRKPNGLNKKSSSKILDKGSTELLTDLSNDDTELLEASDTHISQ